MHPAAIATVGLVVGLLFPALGVFLGARGPVLALLGAVPPVVAALAWTLGRQRRAMEDTRGDLQRTARARRDEIERAAAELAQHSRALAAAVATLTSSAEETAAGARDTSGTMTGLSATATASALTAETVVGLALESERAAARGLSTAEQAREALARLAREVHTLSEQVRALDGHMRDVAQVAEVVGRIAERSRTLSALARSQARADGGVLAPEAFPALLARMEGHAEDTAEAAARARAILDEVRAVVAGAVGVAEEGSVRAGEGAMVIEGAAATLRELARALGSSATAGREIAGVAQQQQAGFDQVMHAVNGIFLASERAAASTREVAAEARAIGELAARLRRAVRPEQ